MSAAMTHLMGWFLFLAVALIAVAARADSSSPSGSSPSPPVALTAEQDHQRMMDLLGIKTLRPPVGNSDPQSPSYVNYDEARANPYPNLPDPLVLNDGRPVTSANMWWKQRRPEIVADFDEDIYGKTPSHTPKVKWKVVKSVREMNGDVPVVTKTLVGHVDNSSYPQISVDIQLTLSTSANATGPAPVIMQLGFDPAFLARFLASLKARGINPPAQTGPTWQQQCLAKGWGYAEYIPVSVQADGGAGLTEGIIGLCNKGMPRKLDDWGVLKAWAWGMSRCMDYFETDKAVDAKRVGIEGHSRYGKATLVAMAYDPRFAIAYVSSSGEGGAKLWRRDFGEALSNAAGPDAYHWYCGNLLKYAGPLTENDLPVDSHELIALCAPRPVFISAGTPEAGDGWVDPKGSFLAAAAAGPVYRLLGKKDLGTGTMPSTGTALLDGDIAFRQHDQGHTDVPNWPTFIAFASRYFAATSQQEIDPGDTPTLIPFH